MSNFVSNHLCRSSIIALILVGKLGGAAKAQAPQALDIFPPGGMRGSHVDAQIEGSSLLGTNLVVVSGTGVKVALGVPATDGNSVPLKIDIAPDAAAGPYELRVVNPKGVSNPTYLWVGGYSPSVELEPNDQPERATKLDKLPATVSGRMNAAEDVDWFSFHAEAGETFAVDIIANRLFSPMDAALELRDAEGRVLELAMEGYDRDPKIIHNFKKSGTYLIQVRDTMYRGGKNFVYRLSVGKVPVITSLWPNGAKRGDNIVSKIDGANLGGTNSLTLQVAADTLSNRPVWLEPMIGSVPALPIAVNLTDYSQSVRSEAPGTSTVLSLDNQSVSIIGNLTKPKEVDAFVFAGQSGKPVQIQVAARGIGSRIMPFVSVVDSAGKILQTTEEEIGRDALFSFNPPANGNFTINISTIDGKFGPDYNYRLTLRPQGGNDFRLSTTPDLLNLGKGQTAIVTVNVDRKDGYGGPVEVSLKGVPTGITATPLVIPAGAASGVFTVTSAPEANGISGFLQIVGVGKSADGKAIEHEANIVATYARPGEGQPAPRLVKFQAVSATDAVGLFTLQCEPAMVTIAPGQTVMVKVKALRKAGDAAANPAINLSASNAPAGISFDAPVIPEKVGEIVLKVTAAAGAADGQGYLIVRGKLGTVDVIAPGLLVVIKK